MGVLKTVGMLGTSPKMIAFDIWSDGTKNEARAMTGAVRRATFQRAPERGGAPRSGFFLGAVFFYAAASSNSVSRSGMSIIASCPQGMSCTFQDGSAFSRAAMASKPAELNPFARI